MGLPHIASVMAQVAAPAVPVAAFVTALSVTSAADAMVSPVCRSPARRPTATALAKASCAGALIGPPRYAHPSRSSQSTCDPASASSMCGHCEGEEGGQGVAGRRRQPSAPAPTEFVGARASAIPLLALLSVAPYYGSSSASQQLQRLCVPRWGWGERGCGDGGYVKAANPHPLSSAAPLLALRPPLISYS
ncbi:unnamed protein product [Closterium sp. Naga37s-1]|nr:unnamed protein product [Closterium sp. Naga37s-1]